MIEINASGPVKTYENSRIDWMDGIDPIVGTIITAETTEVKVDLELPQGHVNLEGFAPSRHDWTMRDVFGRYVRDTVDGHFELVESEWNVEIDGNYWDWIQQAHRYNTERPEKSLIDCLGLFLGWEETRNNAIEEAILQVHEETDYGSTESGELSSEERSLLRYQLNQIYEVTIPGSYRNDDEEDTNNTINESQANRQSLRSA